MRCSPYEYAASLLGALGQTLAQTRAGVPERMAVYPHAEPAIEACEMGWVGIGPVAPGDRDRLDGCSRTWTLTLTVGVQRCYPVKEKNAAPTPVEVDSAARDVLDDGEAMRRAVLDMLDVLDESGRITGWRTIPPQGGMHGSRMDVQMVMQWGSFSDEAVPPFPGDPRG